MLLFDVFIHNNIIIPPDLMRVIILALLRIALSMVTIAIKLADSLTQRFTVRIKVSKFVRNIHFPP